MISEKYQESIAIRQSVKLSQKAWKYIYDQNSHPLDSLNETAVSTAARDFSYGLMSVSGNDMPLFSPHSV